MTYNRLITSLLATCMLVNTVIPAFALDDVTIGEQNLDSSGQEATVPVTLDSEEAIFSVQVPSNLPIVVTSQGEVLTATNAKVVNNSAAPVEISDFEIESQSGWTFVDYDSFEKSDIGRATKNAAFRVGAVKTTGNNTTDFNESSFNVMSAYDPEGENNIVDFSYDIKIPAMDSPINEQIANITFIVDWASGIVPVGYIIRVPEDIQDIGGVYQLGYNQSCQLTAVEEYGVESGIWESSQPSVISIDPESGYATAVGEGTCTIYYTKGNLKGSVPFNVSYSAIVDSIEVANNPNKLEYHVGDNFDSSGLQLKVTYDDGHTKIVDTGFTILDGDNLQPGTSEVTVQYGGATTKIAINVVLTGYNININPSVDYVSGYYQLKFGESYTLSAQADGEASGIGTWKSDDSEIISVDSVSGVIQALKPGKTTVWYTNGNLGASINLEVLQSRVPQSVSVKTNPDKTKYYVGENFDSTGLELEVTYTDGHTETKDAGFAVVNGTNLQLGTASVTVTYTELDTVVQCEVTVTIEVLKNTLNKQKFKEALSGASSILFGFMAPGGGEIPVSDDGNIVVSYKSSAAYIINKTGDKIIFPKDCSGMFEGLNLSSIDFDTDIIDTSNVENMSSMFSGCEATSIDLSSFNTSAVTDMNNMFYGCAAESIDLSSFNTSVVTDMSYMFYSCRNLRSLVLDNFDTRNVEDMSSMFAYLWSLSTLDLSSFDMSNVSHLDGMFYDSWAIVNAYGRTEDDCSRLNSSSNKPEGINFIVKS